MDGSSLTTPDTRGSDHVDEALSGFPGVDGTSRNTSAPEMHATSSPPRSPVPSVPSSPNPQSTPASVSPLISTPIAKNRLPDDGPPVPRWNAAGVTSSGVHLGLNQLERQQEEAERRRLEQTVSAVTATPQSTRQVSLGHVPARPRSMEEYLDDDENTQPSSTQDSHGNTGDSRQSHSDDASSQSMEHPNKLERIIRYTSRRLSSGDLFRGNRRDSDDPADEEDSELELMLIYGHLQKLGRNGKWQTRWFETDGECLSYYKTSKRTMLLATLDLEKVGSIAVREEDPKGCSFTIQVLGRPYYLRAESRARCKDWVITLNRVKEARLEQGNVKLVNQTPPDLFDQRVSVYSSRVVTEANRPRTRAVDEDVSWEELVKNGNPDTTESSLQYDPAFEVVSSPIEQSMPQVVLARWQKRRSAMSRLAAKLARWARSLKKYKCTTADGVVLDRHVHPPGHDDGVKKKKGESVESKVPIPMNASSLTSEDGISTTKKTLVVCDTVPNHHIPPVPPHNEDEEETRELS